MTLDTTVSKLAEVDCVVVPRADYDRLLAAAKEAASALHQFIADGIEDPSDGSSFGPDDYREVRELEAAVVAVEGNQ